VVPLSIDLDWRSAGQRRCELTQWGGSFHRLDRLPTRQAKWNEVRGRSLGAETLSIDSTVGDRRRARTGCRVPSQQASRGILVRVGKLLLLIGVIVLMRRRGRGGRDEHAVG